MTVLLCSLCQTFYAPEVSDELVETTDGRMLCVDERRCDRVLAMRFRLARALLK